MPQEEHRIWDFFASVKLALVIIALLALTSIIGTVIPQGKPPGYYLLEYGPGLAGLFQALDLTDMYGSWWFVALLIIFAVNLVVCSLHRLPTAWRLVSMDHLATEPGRLEKLPLRRELTVVGETPAAAATRVAGLLTAAGWPSTSRQRDDGVLLFAQKGSWSRLGAYLIHIGILIVLVGALIGSVFGYKASVMFPEGATIDHVFEHPSARPVPLGFELRLENFTISYYPNGMAREFRSEVTLFDPALAAPLESDIRVNHPLRHRGLAFYQASYQARPEFYVTVRNQASGRERLFPATPEQPVIWPEEEVTFQVVGTRTDEMGRVHEFQISFADPGAEPSLFRMRDLQMVTVQRPAADYSFHIRQRYSTGLQVAKDPGVWVVYTGFLLMLCGLYIVFMVTHRRVWAWLRPEGEGKVRLLLAGGSNRNKASFDRSFGELVERLGRDAAIDNQGRG